MEEKFEKIRRQQGDIELKEAMILWNPVYEEKDQELEGVLVVKYPDISGKIQNLTNLSRSDGACYYIWREYSKNERIREIVLLAWRLVIKEGLTSKQVHTAFKVIPEYRALMGLNKS